MAIETPADLALATRDEGIMLARYITSVPWGPIRGNDRTLAMAAEMRMAQHEAERVALEFYQDMTPSMRAGYHDKIPQIANRIVGHTVKALRGQGFNMG